MKDQTRWTDPIVEEVRRHGEAYSARFKFDIEPILADLQRQQAESGAKIVSFVDRSQDHLPGPRARRAGQ